ncbi:hypothetical protein HMPREF9318_00100 [Streptococcus urinalis FB127-CNA-2]|uniref:Prophage LambdaSa1, N-acetylmuramoyl-L-alanine amidase, family 4 family protein n=1 Tax=Streptococcus urinalis 2285-97 TaxID=764291 RepID=G5KEK5_9STRE|nr:hypothetical protein [Streptococcus urinalis]QBX22163.1 tail assembly protein [Streptococcus phage Javan637]QBX31619.1 tail assembly protein [Streptococcus phage Javan642]QBX31636.1 tail assembly protein [Streptococcus phage Javan648]EHJ56477.1 prophage LambdaSa1, N-acetylmuramoyl-L-alanine amidase, family 4 family protein [Streptococcus urinalis 2285-97]EKS21902.1 hypothetical protein HMPREF9318_00100 [Streptococcus urinalis FB127-CNA-2]
MQIAIHNSNGVKVASMNNDIYDMLHYSNDIWHRYLSSGGSTFDFTVSKVTNGMLHPDVKYLNDSCYFSFVYQGKTFKFYVMTMTEDSLTMTFNCNSLNLELNNEFAQPYTATEAMTIEEYCQKMDLLSFANAYIGLNEISDRKRTLTFDSTEETKLARLLSLVSQFDAEIEFDLKTFSDGRTEKHIYNFYHAHDDSHNGVGRTRNDILLRFPENLNSIQVVSDRTQQYTMGVFKGTRTVKKGDGDSATEESENFDLTNLERSDKNNDGIEEFYTRKGNPAIYAPLAAKRYPTAEGSSDLWTKREFVTEYSTEEDLASYGFRQMKQFSYPQYTYTAIVNALAINSYSDLSLGDVIRLQDIRYFTDGLVLNARILEQIKSFSNPQSDSIIFSNYLRLSNGIDSTLAEEIQKLIDNRLPYTIDLSTNNGTTFKNGNGLSRITPTLKRGNKVISCDWRWIVGNEIKSVSPSYVVDGSTITAETPLTVTVDAYIDNKLVATREITFTNMTDGSDGKSSYLHVAYANSLDGKQDFSLTESNGRSYRGEYSDFLPISSDDPTKYTWARFKGEKGDTGLLDDAKLKKLTDTINTKADNQLTQAQLDALSEQAELAKAELNAKVSADTLNQIVLAYNEYVRANENDKQEAEQSLIEWSQRVEVLGTQLGDVKSTVNYLDTYISQSAKGISIGKSGSNSSMLISNDRISMFSAGNEVMYISQGIIHIENGIFSKTIQIGRYREEQYVINPDMNVMRYVGGS